MSFMKRLGKSAEGIDGKAGLEAVEAQDQALKQALANFRCSVLAWSEAEFGRERTPAKTVRQRSWRLAAGWALGCVLVAGGAGGGCSSTSRRCRPRARRKQPAQPSSRR